MMPLQVVLVLVLPQERETVMLLYMLDMEEMEQVTLSMVSQYLKVVLV